MALAVFVLSVAVVDPAGLAPFGPAKWAAVSTALLGAAAVAATRPVPRSERGFQLAWAALLGLLAISAAVGLDDLYAWIGTPERHFGWLTWALCALAFAVGRRAGGEQRSVTRAVVVLGAVAGGYGLAELFGWQPLSLTGTSGRPGSVMGSSAFLGALACLVAPVAAGVARDRGEARPVRVVAAAAFVLVAVALVGSGARAAWLGGAAALALGMWRTRSRSRSGTRRGSITSMAVVGVAAGLLVATALATGVVGRATSAVADRDGGARGRLDEWRVATRVIADHPIVGVGPEGYRIAFAGAVDADYDARHSRDPLPDRAHSAILDVTATGGLAAGLAYLALLSLVARRARDAIRDGSVTIAGLAAGVVAYLVQSMFLFPIAELDPLVWLLAGIVVAATPVPERLHAEQLAPADVRARPRVTAAALTVAATGALAVGSLDVAADRSARATLDAVASGHEPADPDRAARLRPDAIRYRLVAARGHEASARPRSFAAAVASLDAAGRLSPRDPVVRDERSRILLARATATEAPADIERAIDSLRSIQRDDPTNRKVRERLDLALELRTTETVPAEDGT